MNIGIIGSGNIGGTLAELFAKAGHQVAVSNSRGPQTLTSLVEKAGPGVKAVTTEDAGNFGEIIILAIPFKAYTGLSAELLAGKIVVDAMNYYPQRDGTIDLHNSPSSEVLARHLSRSHVVKAFNTIYYVTLANEGDVTAPAESRLALFIAGDDAHSKATVAKLIDEIGFSAVETGNLSEGSRLQEPGSKVYGKDLKVSQAREMLENS